MAEEGFDEWPAAAKVEIERLRQRLAAAEQVCVLYSWIGIPDQTDRGKAALQAWIDWSHQYGPLPKSAEWNDRITELARRRDEIRAATLRKIREESE